MKPSEELEQRTSELYQATLGKLSAMTGGLAITEASQVRAQAGALERTLGAMLDTEHERRAAFEADVLRRLGELEQAWGRRHEPPLERKPIRCCERMPDAETRVLFFVPGHKYNRWRVGHWDNTAREPRRWDAETESGDGPILYKPEQVTHWMPMLGEPT